MLEGVLDGLLANPIENARVICVPFVDFDGVVDGDQGKARSPYDHNRDYDIEAPAIYPETAAIRKFAENGVLYAFDFHSPWHCFNENDTVFIVRNRESKLAEFSKFSAYLENNMNEYAFQYKSKNDYPPETNRNSSKTSCFANYMLTNSNADIAFTLETAYFGTEDNIFLQENAVELGRCFAKSIKDYDDCYKRISFTGDIMCSHKMLNVGAEDYSCMFAEIEDELKTADYLVGNLETPIAGKELLYTYERYCFNTSEIYLDALKKCEVDLLTLANNHALDRDEEGIVKTLDNCRSRGFDTIGIYKTKEERDFISDDGNGIENKEGIIDANYAVLVNLYIKEKSGKIKTKIGFKVIKNIITDGQLPKTVNTYNEYMKNKSEKLKNEILFYAGRFADSSYDRVEYFIEL